MSGHTHIHTHIHTYTHDNYYNPRCAHAHRGLIKFTPSNRLERNTCYGVEADEADQFLIKIFNQIFNIYFSKLLRLLGDLVLMR